MSYAPATTTRKQVGQGKCIAVSSSENWGKQTYEPSTPRQDLGLLMPP